MSTTFNYECKCKGVKKNTRNIFNTSVLICKSCFSKFSGDKI